MTVHREKDQRILRDYGIALGPDGVPLDKASAGFVAGILLLVCVIATAGFGLAYLFT